MIKELVISLIIVIVIFIGNIVTANYTSETVQDMSDVLNDLREEIIKDDNEINNDLTNQKMNEICEKWDNREEKLSYYIEHNELEKVKTELTALKGYIEKEEYTEATAGLDKSIYILKHIKEKNALKLKNIF